MQEDTNNSSLKTQLGCLRGFIPSTEMMKETVDIASVEIAVGKDFYNRNMIQNIFGINFVRSLHKTDHGDQARLYSIPSLHLKAKGIFQGEIKDISSKGYLVTAAGNDIYYYRFSASKGWKLFIHYKSKLPKITDVKIAHFNNSIVAIQEENIEIFYFFTKQRVIATTEENTESRTIEINEDLQQIYITTIFDVQVFSIQDSKLIHRSCLKLDLNKCLESYAKGCSYMSIYLSTFRAPYLLIFIVNNEGEVQQLLMLELKEQSFTETLSITMYAFDDEFVPLYQAGSVIINSVYCPFRYQEVNLLNKEWKDLNFQNGKIVGFYDPYVLVEDKDHLIIKRFQRDSMEANESSKEKKVMAKE